MSEPEPLDIRTAEADVIKLAVAEFVQDLAGEAAGVPGGNGAEGPVNGLDHTINGDGAKRRRGGRHSGGHSGYPFAVCEGDLAFAAAEIGSSGTRGNGGPDNPALRGAHDWGRNFALVIAAKAIASLSACEASERDCDRR